MKTNIRQYITRSTSFLLMCHNISHNVMAEWPPPLHFEKWFQWSWPLITMNGSHSHPTALNGSPFYSICRPSKYCNFQLDLQKSVVFVKLHITSSDSHHISPSTVYLFFTKEITNNPNGNLVQPLINCFPLQKNNRKLNKVFNASM